MPLLPPDVNRDTYWQSIYKQPIDFWLPALKLIWQQHHLPIDEFSRFALGRNIVLGCGEFVIKLSPPAWVDEIPREADALNFVHNRLSVATPELVAHGRLEEWAYLIQRRLPGELLSSLWTNLPQTVKLNLVRQQGEIMAALHALPIDKAPASLAFDWQSMLDEQRAECEEEMREGGVPEALIADLPIYLAQAEPLIATDGPITLLHGDLHAINLLVEEKNQQLRITGLVDWGDVKIGAISHEFISPGIHSFRGDQEVLHAWYDGYGLHEERRTSKFVHKVMARSLLYYAGEFGRYLKTVLDAETCEDWAEVAERFWHIKNEVPERCPNILIEITQDRVHR